MIAAISAALLAKTFSDQFNKQTLISITFKTRKDCEVTELPMCDLLLCPYKAATNAKASLRVLAVTMMMFNICFFFHATAGVKVEAN